MSSCPRFGPGTCNFVSCSTERSCADVIKKTENLETFWMPQASKTVYIVCKRFCLQSQCCVSSVVASVFVGSDNAFELWFSLRRRQQSHTHRRMLLCGSSMRLHKMQAQRSKRQQSCCNGRLKKASRPDDSVQSLQTSSLSVQWSGCHSECVCVCLSTDEILPGPCGGCA